MEATLTSVWRSSSLRRLGQRLHSKSTDLQMESFFISLWHSRSQLSPLCDIPVLWEDYSSGHLHSTDLQVEPTLTSMWHSISDHTHNQLIYSGSHSHLYVTFQFFEKTRVAVKAGEGFGQVGGQVLVGTWLRRSQVLHALPQLFPATQQYGCMDISYVNCNVLVSWVLTSQLKRTERMYSPVSGTQWPELFTNISVNIFLSSSGNKQTNKQQKEHYSDNLQRRWKGGERWSDSSVQKPLDNKMKCRVLHQKIVFCLSWQQDAYLRTEWPPTLVTLRWLNYGTVTVNNKILKNRVQHTQCTSFTCPM